MNYLKDIHSPDDLKKIGIKELDDVAQEIRDRIIEVVSKNGGHLAPGLGMAEITIAMHYVFNAPKDKIVWDVGHQAYPHKLLTGRFESFDGIRQYKGISGFPNKYESPYDIFTVGHSSTAISQALALAVARDLQGGDERVIAVVGDGGLTGGMAFEGLNNTGQLKKDVIVILNDNEMSIAKNVGALSDYLTRIITKPIYGKVKGEIRGLIQKLPQTLSERVLYRAEKLEESLKGLLVPGMLFEELGFFYIGPIDGHNIPQLINTFQSVKKMHGPILLHVLTKKGKGYQPSEEQPVSFHGTAPFYVESGKVKGAPSPNNKTYTQVFTDIMMEWGRKDKRVIGITAAMPGGVGLQKFGDAYPDRFFDVGIAEQHAVTFAGGLAVGKCKPVAAIYATFLKRACDQLVQDVCIQDAPVVFAVDRTGLVGQDGATHHGVFPIALLRAIPNMKIALPKDAHEMRQMFDLAMANEQGAFAVCYPKGTVPQEMPGAAHEDVMLGKAEVMVSGNDVAIFALGNLSLAAYDAALTLKEEGITTTVVNMRFVKPFDEALLLEVVKKIKHIIVIEEGVLHGGVGALILEILAKHDCLSGLKVRCMGLPDAFIEHGSRDALLQEFGLSKEGIVAEVKTLLGKKSKTKVFMEMIGKGRQGKL